MSRRTEKIASIRKNVVQLADSLDEHARDQNQLDYSCLSDDELLLYVKLTRKAYDCQDLMRVATQELRKSFDFDRLTPSEQDEYQVLTERLTNSPDSSLPP